MPCSEVPLYVTPLDPPDAGIKVPVLSGAIGSESWPDCSRAPSAEK